MKTRELLIRRKLIETKNSEPSDIKIDLGTLKNKDVKLWKSRNSKTIYKIHITEAIVVHCIDFRFQQFLDPWLQNKLGNGNYDRVSLAGGVFNFDAILEQVKISKELHEIEKVILVNHEECGAYGDMDTYERHKEDLERAKLKIETLFPDLNVEIYYLHLNGTFEQLSRTNL